MARSSVQTTQMRQATVQHDHIRRPWETNPKQRGATSDNPALRLPASPQEWGRASGVEMPRNDRERERERNRRRRYRQYLASEKLRRGSCLDCGLEVTADTVCVFDFDHRDPATKSKSTQGRNFRDIIKVGFEALIRELTLCDLVCANCHRMRTKRQVEVLGRWWENEQEPPEDLQMTLF